MPLTLEAFILFPVYGPRICILDLVEEFSIEDILGVQLGMLLGGIEANFADPVLIDATLGVQLGIEFGGILDKRSELASADAILGVQLGIELDILSLDIIPSVFIGSLLNALAGGGGMLTCPPTAYTGAFA